MAKATGEFICLTDLPRASVATALQAQARTDFAGAVAQICQAFKFASERVRVASQTTATQELLDAVASSRLEVNTACDRFHASIGEAERMFQAGIDLQMDEPGPPEEEAPSHV